MGWWKTAKPGDKVVCVNTSWGGYGVSPYPICPLKNGNVYEVSAIILSDGVGPSGSGVLPSVVIAGVQNLSLKTGEEIGFDVLRFRPVQTKSTDTGMAILKRILERPHQRIEEDA